MTGVLSRVFSSTIGLKFIVGITGAGMFAFVLQHMLGHLQMFIGPDAYNQYAENMQALGALKWGPAVRCSQESYCTSGRR
jgi:succinate dehydrogenase / fumarate reductase cytochrome b subunit